MKELSIEEIVDVSGAEGGLTAQLAGGLIATWAFRSPYAGVLGSYIGGMMYNGIRNGHQKAPGVSQGLGSYNPNYNPRLLDNGWNYSQNRECNFDPFNDNDNCY